MEKVKPARVRIVKRDASLPQYASLKNCNQINPLCWVAVNDEAKEGRCGVYQIRKLIVEPQERKPLPSSLWVNIRKALKKKNYLESEGGSPEENIVRSNVGKSEYLLWMEKYDIAMEDSIYLTLTTDEIAMVSLYAYFKDDYLSVSRPRPLCYVPKNSLTFLHPDRGRQPIHTWVNFEHISVADSSGESDDDSDAYDYVDNEDSIDDNISTVVKKPPIPLWTKTVELHTRPDYIFDNIGIQQWQKYAKKLTCVKQKRPVGKPFLESYARHVKGTK